MSPSPTRADALKLAHHAACSSADPGLFDYRTLPHAAVALAYCAECPVVALCDQIVRPADSWFDGVAAGQIWSKGVPAGATRGRRPPTIRSSCGTEHGYERHRLASEQVCPACKTAKSQARSRRRALAKERSA